MAIDQRPAENIAAVSSNLTAAREGGVMTAATAATWGIRGPQPETEEAIRKLRRGTVAEEAMQLGLREYEPLLVAMDGMIRYAKAYMQAYGDKLVNDDFLCPPFAEVIKGLRAMLNGDGAVAMERGITTDSKDNGVIEELYWTACEIAGIEGE